MTSSPTNVPRTPSYPPIDSTHLRRLFLDSRLRWEAQTAAVGVEADLDTAWAALESSLDEYPILRRQVLGDAAGPPANDETDAGPVAVLPPVREAVRLMEAVYFRLRLGGQPGSAAHRRSLPWLNRFGRWTGAASFRRWWPRLVPLHDSDFVRFAQNELGLPPLAGHFGAVRALTAPADDEAYALRRWREELGRVPPATATVFGFFLRFDSPWDDVNAAIAVVEWDAQAPQAAGWHAQDLYVPAGLWGIGLGETFLGRLLDHLAAAGCRLVQVEAPPPSQGGAHLHPLYSGARFLRRTIEPPGGEPRTWFERRLP